MNNKKVNKFSSKKSLEKTISSKARLSSLIPIFFLVLVLIITLFQIRKKESMDIRRRTAEAQEDYFKIEASDPEYAPGELLVKYKQHIDPDQISIQNNKSLYLLETKYKVVSKEDIYKDILSPQEKLEDLQEKLSNPNITQQERQEIEKDIQVQKDLIEKLEQRQKRAPPYLSTPKLGSVYLLKMEEANNLDIKRVAQEFSQDDSVEYAEPNYFAKASYLTNDTYVDPDQNGTWSTGAWGQSYYDMWGLEIIEWHNVGFGNNRMAQG
jgi:hypothetical protein